MCDVNGKILFCTCTEEKKAPKTLEDKDILKNETSLEEETPSFSWFLSRANGRLDDNTIIGSVMKPALIFDNVISSKFILHQLNTQNCFDFDYTPADEDSLSIMNNSSEVFLDYMSFVYRHGKWDYRDFEALRNEYELEKSGSLKIYGDCITLPETPKSFAASKKPNFFKRMYYKLIGKNK